MKKNIILRCIMGALIGPTINTAIAIIVSIIIGDGYYHPAILELIHDCGSELGAVILQSVCSSIYGAIWAGSSIIWDQEQWSLIRQTLTHLLINSISTFPVAYYMHWMHHSVAGIVSYIAIFLLIYLIIWIMIYLITGRRINQINNKLRKNQHMCD